MLQTGVSACVEGLEFHVIVGIATVTRDFIYRVNLEVQRSSAIRQHVVGRLPPVDVKIRVADLPGSIRTKLKLPGPLIPQRNM